MRNPGGYAYIVNPSPAEIVLEGGRVDHVNEGASEYDTFRCGHCGSIRHVRVRERPEDLGGLCKQCMKLICPHCVNEMRCTPLEKRIEQMEQRDYLRRSFEV